MEEHGVVADTHTSTLQLETETAAEGIGHVQLVIDPVTPAGLEALMPVLEALDAG